MRRRARSLRLQMRDFIVFAFSNTHKEKEMTTRQLAKILAEEFRIPVQISQVRNICFGLNKLGLLRPSKVGTRRVWVLANQNIISP